MSALGLDCIVQGRFHMIEIYWQLAPGTFFRMLNPSQAKNI